MTTLESLFSKSRFVYDRMVTDSFVLPNTYEQIKIQPNEYATAKTFNQRIERLFDNLIYLYGLCKVASFNVPKTYEGWIGYAFGDIENIFFYGSDFSTSFANSVLSSTFYQSEHGVSFYSTVAPNTNNVIYTTRDFITILSLDEQYDVTPIIQQTNIDPLSGSLCFSQIGSIATYNDDILYVSDTVYNNIYSYKLKDVISPDYVKSQKLFLLYNIGGIGTSKDKLKFSTIGKILIARDNLIVEDRDNKCFKVYDKDLNWVNTSVATTFFNTISNINCIAYSEKDKKLYACNNRQLFLLDVKSDFSIVSSAQYDLDEVVPTDKVIDIKFAHYDKNVFYILTQKTLIKKWITKPEKNIGILASDGNIFGGDIFQWFTVSKTTDNKSDIILTTLKSTDNVHYYGAIFKDDLNLITLFKHKEEVNYYDIEDVKINPNEYNSAWIYNKSIKKFLYNMSLFVNNIGYRFHSGENNVGTPVYLYKGYNDFFRTNTVFDTNTFSNIFINENFQAETINRCFKLLYDYQQRILTEIISNDPVFTDLSPRKLQGFEYKFYTGGY